MSKHLLVFCVQGFVAFGKKPLAESNCLYALGGGKVVDGTFPEPRILSAQCRMELRAYIVSGPLEVHFLHVPHHQCSAATEVLHGFLN